MSETLAQRATEMQRRLLEPDWRGPMQHCRDWADLDNIQDDAARMIEALAAANAQLERERDGWKSVADHWASKAPTLTAERDAATSALAKAEGEIKRLREVQPDMFWITDNPEQCHSDPSEVLGHGLCEPDDIIEMDTATLLGNIWVWFPPVDEGGNNPDHQEFSSQEEAEAARAARAALTPAPEAPKDGE